jgi:hypothetical protein
MQSPVLPSLSALTDYTAAAMQNDLGLAREQPLPQGLETGGHSLSNY